VLGVIKKNDLGKIVLNLNTCSLFCLLLQP